MNNQEKKKNFISNLIISAMRSKGHPATDEQKEIIKEAVETLISLGL